MKFFMEVRVEDVIVIRGPWGTVGGVKSRFYWCQARRDRNFSEPPINGTRAASPAGGEQVSGLRVAQPIVRLLQQRAI